MLSMIKPGKKNNKKIEKNSLSRALLNTYVGGPGCQMVVVYTKVIDPLYWELWDKLCVDVIWISRQCVHTGIL